MRIYFPHALLSFCISNDVFCQVFVRYDSAEIATSEGAANRRLESVSSDSVNAVFEFFFTCSCLQNDQI